MFHFFTALVVLVPLLSRMLLGQPNTQLCHIRTNQKNFFIAPNEKTSSSI